MRSCIPDGHEQLLSILESEEEAPNQEGHQPPPASADGGGSSMPAMGDVLGWRLSKRYPRLRRILVWNNLAGHHSDEIISWLFAHGIMPLYTPLSAS